jgi:PAS domain S-box-containing protein
MAPELPHSSVGDPTDAVGASPHAFIEEAPIATYVKSLSHGLEAMYVSPQIETMLGWASEDFCRPGFVLEVIHPHDRERVVAASQRVRETGERFVEEFRIKAKDGRIVWVHDETVPVLDERGETVHLQGYLLDITEARRREIVLEGQRRVLELIARGAPLEETLLALSRTIEEASEGVLASVQVLNEEGDGFEHCLAPSLPPELTLLIAAAPIGPGESPCGDALDCREPVIVPDATIEPRWPALRDLVLALGRHGFWSVPVLSAAGQPLGTLTLIRPDSAVEPAELELARDAAHLAGIAIERARDEEGLRAAEAKYRTLVERLPIGTYINSFGTTLSPLYVSPQLEELTGYPLEQWKEPGFVSRLIHPDDRARVLEEVVRTHELGETFSDDYRLLAADGRVVWVHDETVAVYGDGGERLFLQGFMLDISERKQLEQQLLHAQKLDAVGRLAGGVAHDFNNLLTAISGYAEFLLAGLAEGDPLREDAIEIQRAADRAAALTRQLLAFSRRQVLQPQPLDLGEVARDLEGLLGRLLGEHVELHAATPESEAIVTADPGQIEQVILNLALNARDAMPDGGTLAIDVGCVDVEPGDDRHPTLPPGPYVSLSVSDTGTGMDPETRGQLFEPFFTTKGPGKGTGLGLATVYGIAAQSGGDVTVETEPGQGSTFTVLLPQAGALDWAPGHDSLAPGGGGETVLLVDDHELFRSLAREILAGAGYRVLEAEDSAAALRLAEASGGIDIVVAELAIGGAELARRLGERFSGLPAVFTADAGSENGHAGDGALVVGKPFTPQSLLHTVRAAITAVRGVGL